MALISVSIKLLGYITLADKLLYIHQSNCNLYRIEWQTGQIKAQDFESNVNEGRLWFFLFFEFYLRMGRDAAQWFHCTIYTLYRQD